MNKILIMLKKELREVFRDKKSLSMMLIIPFMIPLIIIGMSALFESEIEKDITTYNKIGFSYELTPTEINILTELKIEYTINNVDKLVNEFNKEKIHTYITKENDNYIINYDENNIESTYASKLAETYLESYKNILEIEFLQTNNIDSNEFNNLLNYDYKVIEQQNFYANYIINYAFLFILMAITISTTYPATDTTAGEKERGTLETLLTFPIKGKDIIIGKLLSVTTSSIITGLLSLLFAILAIIYVGNTYSIYENITLLNSQIILTALIIIIVYSILISSLCIAIASKCKTFKEAQSALTPITFISLFPGMIVFMLNIKNNIILSAIPFINYSIIFDDVINNNLNILNLIIMFISTFIFIFIVIKIVIKKYTSEKILFII